MRVILQKLAEFLVVVLGEVVLHDALGLLEPPEADLREQNALSGNPVGHNNVECGNSVAGDN